ncbi:helix-turn-helix transcriptional regulator [Actinomycetospora cinnamomea]|uniref:Regulatory LuxR family protein n=1 Tax=Actinomycetospora cinnamomea TaxID=663609 RepID=A0A2U1F669_9PSEU|nr:helix-turn-helix transcriptional regulator [Actinomycetospora cinnamomea]PVZ07668.1 regulatory LuxR family protein [Actinomycetospora cinnamomea]
MPDSWPLVGRGEVLSTVTRLARTGRRAGVVIVGPPGCGRTRLARAALAAVAGDAEGPTWAPRWLIATSATAPFPLGAVSHLLSGQGADLGENPLFAARRRLVADAGGARLLLAVDDAHWLDGTSAALVQQLAAADEAFVIVTVPSGTPVRDAVFALWKEGLADRLDIGDLERADHDTLLRSALGDHVDEATLRRLWDLSRGNPLFLRELVDAARAAGTLRRVGQVWRWDGPVEPTPRLVELVERQMGRRSPEDLELLTLIAFGEPLGSELLAGTVAPETLTRLEHDGLLSSVQRGRRVDVSLTHPLHAEVLRRQASPWQTRQAFRRLTEALERTGARRGLDRARLLWWREEQGIAAGADDLVSTAEAVLASDRRLATQLARAAIGRSASTATTLRLGRVLVALALADDAERVLAAAMADRDATGHDARAHRALALLRVPNLCWGLHDLRTALRVVDEIDPPTGGDGTGTVEPGVAVLRAYRRLMTGCPVGPDPALESGAHPDPDLLDPDAADHGLAVAALAAALAGDHARALALAERAEAAAPPGRPRSWTGYEARTARWYAHLLDADLPAAEAVAQRLREEALLESAPEPASLAATWLGIVAARRGRLPEAVRWLQEAAAAVRASRFPFTLPLVSEIAVALASLGGLDRARAALAEAEPLGDEVLFSAWTWTARVWLAGLGGRRGEAVRMALDTPARAGRLAVLQSLHAVVRIGEAPPAVVAELDRLAARGTGRLHDLYAAHARAVADADPRALDTAAQAFADRGMLLLAAEAAAQACAAHRAAGRPSSARASAVRARGWAPAAAVTPALALLDGADELTPRETEIASLAAGGLTSRAIASQLVVSVRTVDNVLASVYQKLGITGRAELPDVVGLPTTR